MGAPTDGTRHEDEAEALPGLVLHADDEPAPGGGRGRRLAVTGITLGVVWTVAVLAVLLVAVLLGQRLLTSVNGVDEPAVGSGVAPDDPSAITQAASELERGDCVLAWDQGAVIDDVDPDVVVVDCTTAHQAQALERVDLSTAYPASAAWPGSQALRVRGTSACSGIQAPAAPQVDRGDGTSLTAIPPTRQAWTDGTRTVTCLVFAPRPTLTESITP